MPSAVQTPPQHTLTYPRNVIAALNPTAYLLAHLNPSPPTTPIRPSGRSLSTFRPPHCTTSSLTHCAGSAVIRVGDTAVVCGIQPEILLASSIADPPRQDDAAYTPESELARLNLLVPNVELATGCSPAHLPGGAPSAEAQTLVQRMNSLLHSSRMVDIEDLRITHTPPIPADEEAEYDPEDSSPPEEAQPETVAYWTLYTSIHVLSLSGTTSLIDVAWAALVAALRDVRLPRAWWDADMGRVLCSDDAAETRKLGLRGMPMCCTWGVFEAGAAQLGADQKGTQSGIGKGSEDEQKQVKTLQSGGKAWLLADPDDFETPLCRESVTITVDASGDKTRLLRIEKSGGAVVGVEDVKALIPAAVKRWKEWDVALR